jgi:hypothetical protein
VPQVLEQLARLQTSLLTHGGGQVTAASAGAADREQCGAGEGGGGSRSEGGGVRSEGGTMETLCKVLLARLKDEELTLRCRSSELLAHADPRQVLTLLALLL